MYTEEMEIALCADHSWDLHMEKVNYDNFIRRELPKFLSVIDQISDGLITIEEFYVRMGELIEPF